MGEIKAIYADNINQLLKKINEYKLSKESIIEILPLEEQYVVIYYGE